MLWSLLFVLNSFHFLPGEEVDCETVIWRLSCARQAPPSLYIWQKVFSAHWTSSIWKPECQIRGIQYPILFLVLEFPHIFCLLYILAFYIFIYVSYHKKEWGEKYLKASDERNPFFNQLIVTFNVVGLSAMQVAVITYVDGDYVVAAVNVSDHVMQCNATVNVNINMSGICIKDTLYSLRLIRNRFKMFF